MRAVMLYVSALILSGCASPQSKLRSGLLEAGLSPKQSACMAERMVNKLSIGQLLKLSSLGNLKGEGVGDMSMKRFLHNVRALEDPEILSISSRAALGCALGV